MNARRVLALLGRRDEPTDAVEEYCRYLGGALRAHGIAMELARVRWAERGWPAALRELRKKASSWRGEWVLVQYTALAWSARGFPLRFLRVMSVLREAGTRTAVIFHDVEPYAGTRTIDEMRRRTQLHTMRRALHRADLAIFTVALHVVSWLGDAPSKAVFIPVGANLAASALAPGKLTEDKEGPLRVAVFGITGGENGRREATRIVEAMRLAAARIGNLELHAFGRQADDCDSILREGLRDVPVDVRVEGVLPPEQVLEALSSADVMLFVRGVISTRRGSAIAGIACGLPVIAFRGRETAEPVTDAGVVLLAKGASAEVGEALVRVLTDRGYRVCLAERSRTAYRKHFAWEAIAARYVEALKRSNGDG
jgi:glycosyltransferase involved in cell wall biosynthesis